MRWMTSVAWRLFRLLVASAQLVALHLAVFLGAGGHSRAFAVFAGFFAVCSVLFRRTTMGILGRLYKFYKFLCFYALAAFLLGGTLIGGAILLVGGLSGDRALIEQGKTVAGYTLGGSLMAAFVMCIIFPGDIGPVPGRVPRDGVPSQPPGVTREAWKAQYRKGQR